MQSGVEQPPVEGACPRIVARTQTPLTKLTREMSFGISSLLPMARTRLRRSGELVIVVISGVGFADGQCLPKERFIARTKRFALLLGCVPAFPALVLAFGEILLGMLLCVVGDQIRRVGSA